MQTITAKEVNAGLTQASDAAFINAFTADGTPIKISKADLASVVAGVWEKGGRNIPLVNRSYDSSSELDLNSTLFQDNGIYDLAGVTVKNFPNHSGGVPQKIYSTLITFQSYYGIQFFFNHDFSGGLWMRTFYRNTKEVLAWKRIIL